MAIATIMPATAGTKYVSAIDCWGSGVVEGDSAVDSDSKAETACDGQ